MELIGEIERLKAENQKLRSLLVPHRSLFDAEQTNENEF